MSSLIPFKKNPLFSLQRELDKLTDFFDKTFQENFQSPATFEGMRLSPLVDFVEDDESFKVEAEIPGMDESNIKVSVDNNVLTISGEKSSSKKDEKKNYRMREISYGHYERRISLPDYIDASKATASFKKGMLWVTFPKKPGHAQQAREIKVEKA